MKTKFIRIAAAVLALTLLLTGCAPSKGNLFVNDYLAQDGGAALQPNGQNSGSLHQDQQEQEQQEQVPQEDELTQKLGVRGTNLSLTQDKQLKITRIPEIQSTPAPQDGKWTVFVYMCGADLETRGECATRDLYEMLNATAACSDLRFVVQTGGCPVWEYEGFGVDGKNARYVIEGGALTPIGQPFDANMGDPDTLEGFLDWGLEDYRSQYIMLDLWDHGGGSLWGVCLDEVYSYDRITLEELDAALKSVLVKRKIKFDMIGCDACLMATIELANICVPYADYMLASEETEPGIGWYYIGFSDGINAKAKAPAELGKYVCNTYYDAIVKNDTLKEEQSEGEPVTFEHLTATLSVIDLSKIDSLLLTFNSFCTDVYNSMLTNYDLVLQNICSGLITFYNNEETGTKCGSNTIDMQSFVVSTSAFSDKAQSVISKLDECVVYDKNGDVYKNAGGIAILISKSKINIKIECLNIVKNLCVTPYYMGILNAILYGGTTMGDISDYDPNEWLDEDSEYWTENDVDPNEYAGWNEEDDGSLNMTGEGTSLLFAVAPHVEERKRESGELVSTDTVGGFIFNIIANAAGHLLSSKYNVYTFTLSNEGMQKVNEIYTKQYALVKNSENRSVILDLGGEYVGSGDAIRQKGYNKFEREFFGMTVGLPNGSPLCVYPVSSQYIEGYGTVKLYCAPVKVNGENKGLIVCEDYSSGNIPKYYAIGVKSLGGEPSRTEPINSGDVIKAVFPGYYADTLEFAGYFSTNYSKEYTFSSDSQDFGLVWNSFLPSGNYYFCYTINDIYGNTYDTPFAECRVSSDDLYPYSMVGMVE